MVRRQLQTKISANNNGIPDRSTVLHAPGGGSRTVVGHVFGMVIADQSIPGLAMSWRAIRDGLYGKSFSFVARPPVARAGDPPW